MAGIQRFITYIYAYEKDDKNQNVGFARIDVRGDYCQVEIHLKRTGYTNMKSPVFLFTRKNNQIVGIPIGQISLNNGAGDFVRRFACEKVADTPFRMGDITGILILLNDEVMFASQWDEREIKREQFQEYDVAQLAPEAPALEETESMAEEEGSTPPITENPTEPEIETPAEETQEPVQAQAAEDENSGETSCWEKLAKTYGVVRPFENAPEILAVRMELKDIKELPQKHWYLGSNSFLLHGFFNYRFLLLGRKMTEDKEEWFLGVPGVFQNQERVLATIFGFPEFRQEVNTEEKTNHFGYWYRPIDR